MKHLKGLPEMLSEGRVVTAARVLLGLAAFGLAFTHTLDWLDTHGIRGTAGVITACCVDVLAAICLRLLLGRATAWPTRVLALLGLDGSVAISAAAQVHSVLDDRVGERLALVPLGAFVLLQVIHEVESRTRAVAPGGRRKVDTRPDSEVDTTGGQVDTAGVDNGAPVSTSVSTPAVHLGPPPVSTWDEVAARLEGASLLPLVARPAPAEEPPQRRTPRPRREPRPRRPDLTLVASKGLPADVLAALNHPDPKRRMTHEQAAAKLGVSARTISRRLGEAKGGAPRERRSAT